MASESATRQDSPGNASATGSDFLAKGDGINDGIRFCVDIGRQLRLGGV